MYKYLLVITTYVCVTASPQLCRADPFSALNVYLAADSTVEREVHPRAIKTRSEERSHREGLRALARRTAEAHGVPPMLFEAVIEHESGFRASELGLAKEVGLAQILPSTGRLLLESGKVKGNLWDPKVNLTAGAVHLRDLRKELNAHDLAYASRLGISPWQLCLAAYNGGLGGVRRSSRTRGRLPIQLVNYVNRVTRIYKRLNASAGGRD